MKLKDFLKLHPMFPVVIFFSFAVSATSFYLEKQLIAFVEFGLGLILAIIVYIAEKKSFNDLKKTVSILNSHIVSENDDHVSAIPLPLVIVTREGGIVWYNDLFEKDIIADNELSNKQIRSFVAADKLSFEGRYSSFDMSYNGKRYTVWVSEVSEGQDGNYALYFIDDTYYKDIADKYDATRPVFMIVSVDAMDDVSSMISQNAFSTLLSDAERLVISWFTHYMCILRKTGDGRFFVIAEYSIFEQMKKDGFDILDSVREHRLEGVPTGLTLSIGVATGNELSACDTAARKSLDMAKGRGGDQVVINDNNSYEFFGGVASGVESRNQVQSRIVAGSIEELIRHSSEVLIMGHKNSDLDALGSAIGIYECAEHLGVEARIVIDEKNSMAKHLLEHYRSKYTSHVFITPAKALSELKDDTLVIVTDVMRPAFAESTELAQNAKRIVVIDHHRMSVDHIEESLIFYHEPNSSSASEMVTELIRYMPSKPLVSKQAAEALLAGIYLDTKNFTLKTGVRTFEAAAYLKDQGADTITVRKLFAATADENTIISKIVNNAVIDGKYAFARTDSKGPATRLASAKAADDLLNIEDVDASFVLFPAGENDVAVSARSYGRVNVQIIMEKLGGGGHQTMAAAQLQNITIDDAIIRLKDVIADVTKRNYQKNKKEE